jgi:uncharacterized protein
MGTVVHPDGVSRLLFGSVRRDVLALLLGRPDERFYLREIMRAAGGGSGAVQRELKQLVEAGLVSRQTRGHQVYFSANQHAPVFAELRAIVEKTAGAADVLRTALSPLVQQGRIDVGLIFGSVVGGRQTARSDIDLLIVGDMSLKDLLPAVRQAEARLAREVNPSVFSPREFRDKLKRGSAFLKRILAAPKIFLAGDDRELGRLAR